MTVSFDEIVPFQNNCFEFISFDIQVNSNLKPFLVDIDVNPTCNRTVPL